MNYKEHLFFSGIVNMIFLCIMDGVFNINPIQSNLFPSLLFTFYIFSLLPDLDHPASHIRGILYLFLIFIFIASIADFNLTMNPINLFRIVFSAIVFYINTKYFNYSYSHRRLPHTFLFGAIACLVLFLLVNSLLVTMVGAISFFSHILCDGHLFQALKKDREMINLIKQELNGKF